MFVKSSIHVPRFAIHTRAQWPEVQSSQLLLIVSPRYETSLDKLSFSKIMTQLAEQALMISMVKKTSAIQRPVCCSRFDFFILLCVEFLMILVSGPVYVTMPTMNSVLRRLQPLRAKFSQFNGTHQFFTVFMMPWNQQIFSDGCSHSTRTPLQSFSENLTVSRGADLCFKLVSPSKFFVSI